MTFQRQQLINQLEAFVRRLKEDRHHEVRIIIVTERVSVTIEAPPIPGQVSVGVTIRSPVEGFAVPSEETP